MTPEELTQKLDADEPTLVEGLKQGRALARELSEQLRRTEQENRFIDGKLTALRYVRDLLQTPPKSK